MPKATLIDDAVAKYARRSHNQAVKRLKSQAERANADRLAGDISAGKRLAGFLRELAAIAPADAKRLAKSFGVA